MKLDWPQSDWNEKEWTEQAYMFAREKYPNHKDSQHLYVEGFILALKNLKVL